MTDVLPTTMPKPSPRLADGEVLFVDKPEGWTSFDVVNRIRHLFGVRRVGHAGTLDPMATGLLVICTGTRTKDVEQFMGLEKEYEGTMFLGARTESYDAETPVVETRPIAGITEQQVRAACAAFLGTQLQLPPMWSAVKVGGRPLYRYARKGKTVERTPRTIEIRLFAPVGFRLPEVDFRVICSKGTYVRSLVNDLGQALGCGAYLTRLRRTRIGPYVVDSALKVTELDALGRGAGERAL